MRPIPCPLAPGELHRLYLVEKLTDQEIVDRLGKDATLKRVRSWRRRFGIETLNRTERSEVTPIEGRLRSLLVGSMLGDGRISRTENASRYQENHSDSQREYIEWKAKEWGPWVSAGVKPVTWKQSDGDFKGWRFHTVSHQILNDWHALFYSEGGPKQLDPKVVDLVDSLALAVWYMDDGSAAWWPIITFGMSPSSREIAFQLLEKFSLQPRWSHCNGNTGQLIFEGEDQAHLFISLVKPHLPECMGYKLDFGFQGPHYQVREAASEGKLRELASQGVSIRAMAEQLGVGQFTVSRYLEKYGIHHPRKVGRPKGS